MKKPDPMTLTVSTRLTLLQRKKLDGIAKSKGISISLLIKHIIVSYLEEHENLLDTNNILQMQILDIKEEIKKVATNQEWFEQLFYTWLETWFMNHPKIENNRLELAKEARNRRNKFIEIFNTKLYIENGNLYDRLIAESLEEPDNND